MFLFHHTGWTYTEVAKMKIKKVKFWIDQSFDNHDRLNSTEENG
jgi:hypothetical protein